MAWLSLIARPRECQLLSNFKYVKWRQFATEEEPKIETPYLVSVNFHPQSYPFLTHRISRSAFYFKLLEGDPTRSRFWHRKICVAIHLKESTCMHVQETSSNTHSLSHTWTGPSLSPTHHYDCLHLRPTNHLPSSTTASTASLPANSKTSPESESAHHLSYLKRTGNLLGDGPLWPHLATTFRIRDTIDLEQQIGQNELDVKFSSYERTASLGGKVSLSNYAE